MTLGGGGEKPNTPASHARWAWPESSKRATKLAMALAVEVAPSSALHAEGLEVKREIAPSRAPSARTCCHWLAARAPMVASAWASEARYTSIGPEPRQTLRPEGTSP